MKKANKILLTLGAISVANVLIAGTASAVSFYDTVGTKYEGAVERLADLGVVQGTSANVFSPDKKVTRAEFAKMLVEATLTPAQQNALNIDDFETTKLKDVKKDEWYYKYVNIAINKGYMQGYEDRTFKPNREVSYSEIAKMVTKALGHTYLNENNPEGWDRNYIDKMIQENLFNYVKFSSPSDKAIRGDVANIIWNMLKADKWEVINRNDATGFTYQSAERQLIDYTYVDHVALVGAKVGGYWENNGYLYIEINGRYYKMFDQKAKANFSSIGGTTDVLLKRVEYPGKYVNLEVIGVSTDVGSQLYGGTYKEFAEDNVKLINKSKLSPNSDYAFLYHYEDDPEKDRVVAVNLSNTYIIDEIKIDDKAIEDKEEDKSHSEVANDFVDDQIAYRYKERDKRFVRTIIINKDELAIPGGAVVFKDNARIEWKDVKKGDVLVEISPLKYYMVQTGTTQDVKLLEISTKKDDYHIETSKGRFDTYGSTLYSDYYSNALKYFNKMKKDDLEEIKGKMIRITQDISDRVVKIELIENEVKMQDVRIGYLLAFNEQGDSKTGYLKLLQDGKTVHYYVTNNNVKADKGDLIQYKMDEKNSDYVASISVIKGSIKLTDKAKLDVISMENLKAKLEYFDDDELNIDLLTYHYKYGKYKYIDTFDVDTITIAECKGLPDDKQIKAYALIDGEGVMKRVFIFDDREKLNSYYAVVNRIYRNYSENKMHAKLNLVDLTEKDLIITNTITCDDGDFIKFEMSDDGKNMTLGEHFSPKNLGYYKDYIVKSINKNSKGKVESYLLQDFGELDMTDWIIDTDENIYRLSSYDVFLLEVSLNDKGNWQIDRARRIKQDTAKLEVGDRIAVNEIEGTAIIYRGYTD